MGVKEDLTGRIFGDLCVIRIFVDEPGKKKKWLCRCALCGKTVVVQGCNLKSGHSTKCKQCACKATGKSRKFIFNKKLYGVWNTMINRCENENTKSFVDYGKRGIKVCDEWKDSRLFMEWAEKNGYEDGLEIDRIDTDGDYTPENCRWVSRLQNARNKRNNKVIEHNGEKKILVEWAEFYGVDYKRLSKLIIKGYSLDDAVNKIKCSMAE